MWAPVPWSDSVQVVEGAEPFACDEHSKENRDSSRPDQRAGACDGNSRTTVRAHGQDARARLEAEQPDEQGDAPNDHERFTGIEGDDKAQGDREAGCRAEADEPQVTRVHRVRLSAEATNS